MEALLLERFRQYLVSHHPELVLNAQQEYPLSRFIRERMQGVLPTLKYLQDLGKAEHEVIALCMEALTKDLRPSKADYLREVLETEFPREFHTLSTSGTLTWNLVKLIQCCHGIFEAFDFRESNAGSTLLRHAVIVEVQAYLTGLKL